MVAVLDRHRVALNMPVGYSLNFRELRKRRGFTQATLAEALGVEQPTVQRWENGTRSPDIAQMLRLAEVLGVEPGELFGDSQIVPLGPRLYVKGEVAAGVWREAWEIDGDEWEAFTGRADVAAPLKMRFGLRVVGDSMDLVFPHGTILECVVWTGADPISAGKRVIVRRWRFDQSIETTVKEYYVDGEGQEWLVPRSSNPSMQAPFRVDQQDQEVERVEIIAIVVGSYRAE